MNDMHYLDLEYPWEGHPSLRSTTFKKDPTEVSGQDVARRGQMPADKAGPPRTECRGIGHKQRTLLRSHVGDADGRKPRQRWRKEQPTDHCDGSKDSNDHRHSTAPNPGPRAGLSHEHPPCHSPTTTWKLPLCRKKKKTGPHQPRKTEPDKLWAGIPTQAADFFLLECPAIQMVSSISCFLPHLI